MQRNLFPPENDLQLPDDESAQCCNEKVCVHIKPGTAKSRKFGNGRETLAKQDFSGFSKKKLGSERQDGLAASKNKFLTERVKIFEFGSKE